MTEEKTERKFNNVVVTGATGLAGSHLVDNLIRSWPNAKIYCFKRKDSPIVAIKHVLDKINLVDIDLTNAKEVSDSIEKIQPDVIFHLAAVTHIPVSYSVPDAVFKVNTLGSLNMLEAMRLRCPNAVMHLCSTCEVYGNVPANEQPIREDNQLKPQNPYAVSKLAADLLGWCYYKTYGMKIIRTRAFSITGPRKRDTFAEASFAKQIAQIERGYKDPIIHVGNLDTMRTFIDARDVVEAYRTLVERGTFGEVYIIGGNSTLTMKDVLNKLIARSAVDVRIETDPKLLRPSDITIQIPDSSKIKNELGWKPKIPVEKSLSDLLDWWRLIV